MKTMHAVNERGNPVATLELGEGVTASDAEMFILRGGVRGAVEIADDGSETTAGLIESFKAAGYSAEVAKMMATADDGPLIDFLPRVVVPKWIPDPRLAMPVKRTSVAVPTREVRLRDVIGALRGESIEIREVTPAGRPVYGRIDYGNGHIVGTKNGVIIR